MNSSILIVEDEAIVALDLKLQLQDLGYGVVGVAASADQAVAAVREHRPGLVLMDVRLQGEGDGIQAAERINRERPTPLIFLTSHSDHETVKRAAHTAPYGYLTKPYQIKELRAGIEVALTKARLERQLREADRWFASTLQCVVDGVVVTDLATRVRFLNTAAEALTGWRNDDAVGRDVAEVVQLLPASARAAGTATNGVADDAGEIVRAVIQDGRPSHTVHGRRLLSREGAETVVDETAGPVSDDDGQGMGAVLVLRDANERLAQEALLRASEERFRNAFDSAPLGMALVSFTGELMQVNDALCQLLARPREALQQCKHTELTLDVDRVHEAEKLHELVATPGSVVQFEKRYLRPDLADPLWTLVSVSLLHDGPKPSCYLYQVHDLSEQKAAAEHLAALAGERMRREASESAHALKTEFLSRVSHEMRTPLNAVIGFAQLLQLSNNGLDPAKLRLYADHIRGAGEHLLGLVTDLLDLNRAATGGLRLELQATALAQSVREAQALLEGLAASHGVTFETSVASDLQVMADPQRLRQVLLNLGSNAIKYNRQGGSVRVCAVRHGQDTLSLTVQDTGIGMTPAQLSQLFQPFDRLGAERSQVPGTGLGLVICRSLIVEMGGSLTLSSEPNTGTTATVLLRAAP